MFWIILSIILVAFIAIMASCSAAGIYDDKNKGSKHMSNGGNNNGDN